MLMPFELKLPNLAITDVSIAAVDRPPLAPWITVSGGCFVLEHIRSKDCPSSFTYLHTNKCHAAEQLLRPCLSMSVAEDFGQL